MRKSASITIVEEPAEDSDLEAAANTMATATMNNGGVVITEAPTRRDYYNQGSTEDVADTPLVINRLEAVSARKERLLGCMPLALNLLTFSVSLVF